MNNLYLNYSPRFLFVDKYEFSEQWLYPEALCPYSMFRYICEGSAEFRINNKTYIVKKGDVFYIPEGSSLYCTAREKITFISIRFRDSIHLPETDMLQKLWNIGQLYHFSGHSMMAQWFETVYTCAISKNSYRRLQIRGYLSLICAELAKASENGACVPSEETALSDAQEMDVDYLRRRAKASNRVADTRIQTLVDYLKMHPQENLSLAQMAEMIAVSESSLRRLFKKEMGKTVYEFTLENKMMLASHLLVTTERPIADICYELGYESPSYFTKRFRENFGVSPQQYRKNAKEA